MRGLLTAVLAFVAWAGAAAAAVPLGELPGTARPLAYRIDMSVDPARERFGGHTEIDIVTTAPMLSMYLHGNGLAMAKAEARTGRMAANPIAYRQVDVSGVAELRFARPLAPGRHTLVFDYDAPFRTGTEGLYRVQVRGQWYAWTQFEATDARRMFPGFDEPGHKVRYTVSIAAPSKLKAFANTPEVAAEPAPAGMTRHRFAPTQPLPTYLVAIGVGDFDVAEAIIPPNAVRSRALPFRIIATKGQRARMDYALAEAPKLLARLEQYFGTAYPWEKLDFLASPIMGGAMENAGLITYDDTLILLDRDAPDAQRRNFGIVAAHEMAHQWFGDLVTPRWWDDIWLNESFAEWMGNRAAAGWRPDLGTDAGQIDGALTAMDGDSRAVGRPVRQPIPTTQDIGAAFDSITYEKGGQVIRMFEAYLGEARFRDGVRLHLKRHAYGSATADQFFASIAEGSRDPRIAPAWRTFVAQQGVPLVTFTRAGDGYRLTQKRYRPIGVDFRDDPAPRWQTPVCARSGEGRACTLLDGAAGALRVVGTAPWVAGNADGAGYYRFSLPPADWDRLIAAGATLPTPEAMTAADSLWAAYAAGEGGIDRVLAGARAFAGHRERLAALLIPDVLRSYTGRVIRDDAAGGYGRLMRALFAPRLAELGLDPARGRYAAEPSARAQLRQSLASYVAIEGRDPATRATLAAAAEAFVGGRADALDPGLRATALSVAVQDRGAPFEAALLAAMVKSTDPLLRRQAASALGAVETPEGARRSLAALATPGLQNGEMLGILTRLFGRTATRDLALGWIDANFDQFNARSGGLLGRVLAVGEVYCSEADARRFERVFRPRLAAMNVAPLDLDRPLASIRQCAAFDRVKGDEIRAALAAVR